MNVNHADVTLLTSVIIILLNSSQRRVISLSDLQCHTKQLTSIPEDRLTPQFQLCSYIK